jgi:hypothetical protein
MRHGPSLSPRRGGADLPALPTGANARRLAVSFPAPGHIQSLRNHGYMLTAGTGADAAADAPRLAGWAGFAASWDRLDPDRWMNDAGRYRRRRFAAFSLADGAIERKRHQPHFQSLRHNRLNGGVARWFSPVEAEVSAHPVTRALLRMGEDLAGALVDWSVSAWHAEMHQFRVLAEGPVPGRPTPEGLHRDGVTAVLMMLVRRHDVAGGSTTLTEDRRFVAEITLSRPMQGIFLDDRRLRHCVSPIQPAIPGRAGWRDALVLTFRPERSDPAFRGDFA